MTLANQDIREWNLTGTPIETGSTHFVGLSLTGANMLYLPRAVFVCWSDP